MLRYASLRLNYCVYLRLMESNAKSWAQRKHAFIQGQDFVKSSCETLQLHIILRFSIYVYISIFKRINKIIVHLLKGDITVS